MIYLIIFILAVFANALFNFCYYDVVRQQIMRLFDQNKEIIHLLRDKP